MKLLSSLVIVFTLLLPRVGWAQDNSNDIVKSTQNDLVVIGAAGIGGAVLGLSTLSFYDKPSKHVSNIWMGAAVGIIAGVIVVAVGHAQKSQEAFEEEAYYSPKTTPDFVTSERYAWHVEQTTPTFRPTLASSLWAHSF